MAYQSEYFLNRYGEKLAQRTPTISHMPAHISCCSPLQNGSANNSQFSLNNVGSLSSLWGNMGCVCYV